MWDEYGQISESWIFIYQYFWTSIGNGGIALLHHCIVWGCVTSLNQPLLCICLTFFECLPHLSISLHSLFIPRWCARDPPNASSQQHNSDSQSFSKPRASSISAFSWLFFDQKASWLEPDLPYVQRWWSNRQSARVTLVIRTVGRGAPSRSPYIYMGIKECFRAGLLVTSDTHTGRAPLGMPFFTKTDEFQKSSKCHFRSKNYIENFPFILRIYFLQ